MVTKLLFIKIEKYNRICMYFDLIKDTNDCKNIISGRITFDKKPISKVSLYLLDKQENETIVQIQETNENGLFLFSNVESGFYLVKGKMQNSIIYEKPFTIE